MSAASALSSSLSSLPQRVAALEQAFRAIEATRMCGLPMLHAGLQVEAVGFAMQAIDEGSAALGILITPWFMNLMLLPLDGTPMRPVGKVRVRNLGGERFEFIGAQEDGFGAYEMCSLFSPMFEFADQAAARATAVEVLSVLRRQEAQAPSAPSRRAFLTGRVRDAGATR